MVKRRRVEVEAVAAPASGEASVNPFVCYFPNGAPPPTTSGITSSNQGYADDIDFTMYKQAAETRKPQHVLVGSREQVDYVGSTASLEYTAPQPCSYAVGVYDKATGKLQLLPVQGGKILRMEALLHGLDYGPSAHIVAEPQTRQEQMALNKRLVDSFGSTRRRRQMTAVEEGQVRVEKLGNTAALTKALEEGVKEAERLGLTREQVLARGVEVRTLPPHHPESKTPSEAYRLSEIIPETAVSSLQLRRLIRAVESEEDMQFLQSKEVVSPYVLGRLHLLRDPDQNKCMYRARALAFLAALLRLVMDSPDIKVNDRTGLEQIARRMWMKAPLLRELLDLFYNHRKDGDQDVYERPAQKKELMLAYILVLAQLVEGGGLAAAQFEALRKELKMSASDLTTRFREVGSKCSSTTVKADGSDGGTQRSFNVTLLKDGDKTLGECLPKIKLGPKKKK